MNLNKNIIYTIDFKGIVVINKLLNKSILIEYPEAAVFQILINEKNREQSIKQIQAILNITKQESMHQIENCLKIWRSNYIIN